MKKILALLSAFVMATLTFTGCSLTETDEIEIINKTETPPVMLFLGDSIPAGYGLDGYSQEDTYSCNSYPNILHESYKNTACGNEMINKAVSGATSQDLLDLINSGQIDDELQKSDAIVVSIGGNDMLGIILSTLNSFGYDESTSSFDIKESDIVSAGLKIIGLESSIDAAISQFENNLNTIASLINAKTDGTLYIQTLYDPFQYFSNFDVITTFTAKKMDKFNYAVFRNAGAKYKVIDVESEFKGKEGELTRISSLDIHPNESGHLTIAKAIDEAFKETGFTYTTFESGKTHLTNEALKLIISTAGVIAVLSLMLIVISQNKKKNRK